MDQNEILLIFKDMVEPVYLLKLKILRWVLEDELHWERAVVTDSFHILSYHLRYFSFF